MKKASFFWVSYSDLMTSLFFLMLVLYVSSFSIVKARMDQVKEIENVEKALSGLDKKYFDYDDVNKRYKLKVDIVFPKNSANLFAVDVDKRHSLYLAGKSLYSKIDSIINQNKSVDYLLIIEGNTQRTANNWINAPDVGYKLSYKRALALYNFWKSKGIDFRNLGNQCEVILAGSGYFGQSRDSTTERNNRRFTIQITSKVGKFLEKK